MRAVISVLAAVTLLALPAGVAALEVSTTGSGAAEDPRWLPWIGCWESSGSTEGADEAPLLVCFRHLADGEGVEITTRAGGELLAREEVRSDGRRVPVVEGGCEGEQWAEWSADGRRLFVHSSMACGEGMTRSTSGVLSIQDSGRRWVEIHAVRADDAEPLLTVSTFRPARPAVVEESGVHAADEGRRLAVATARAAAARALTPGNVSEAFRQVGSEVTRALIVEAGHVFALDAETLRTLKAEGVSEEVLDVMVAVSYPERFAIAGGTQDPVYQARQPSADRDGRAYAGPRYRGYSLWGSRYYGYGYGYGNMYGYSPYGWGPGWGFGGGYWTTPVVIVQPPTVQDRTRFVRGRGYVNPGAASRGATPRGGQPAQGARSPDTRAPSSSQPATRSAPAPRAESPRTPPPPRRARPRDPGL